MTCFVACGGSKPAPTAAPTAEADESRVLEIARGCANAAPYEGKGTHGSALILDRAASITKREDGMWAVVLDETDTPPADGARTFPDGYGLDLVVDAAAGTCRPAPAM